MKMSRIIKIYLTLLNYRESRVLDYSNCQRLGLRKVFGVINHSEFLITKLVETTEVIFIFTHQYQRTF